MVSDQDILAKKAREARENILGAVAFLLAEYQQKLVFKEGTENQVRALMASWLLATEEPYRLSVALRLTNLIVHDEAGYPGLFVCGAFFQRVKHGLSGIDEDKVQEWGNCLMQTAEAFLADDSANGRLSALPEEHKQEAKLLLVELFLLRPQREWNRSSLGEPLPAGAERVSPNAWKAWLLQKDYLLREEV